MTPAIQIRQVHKRFGAVQALAGIDLEVAPGEFFGLLGPNGAGKTTLINILAGLARADSGSVRVMGHDVIADYRESRRALGVVPQELVFDPFFSVRETLRFQSGYFGLRQNDAWIDEVMRHLDLTGKADANMRSLSGGMKRRVLVAQALVHKPPVIVLDEPTAGVDVELRQGLWEFVRGLNREGHTIVLTTHYLEEAEALCARIAMLKQGRIVALDTTNNLINRHDGLYLKLRIVGAALPAALAARVRDSHDPVHTLRLRSYAEVEGVLAQVREAGAQIEELELLQPDLEDVFVQIMNREERGEMREAALPPSSRLGPPGSRKR
jgi:ABC-2 type transport system ATP-binding protein